MYTYGDDGEGDDNVQGYHKRTQDKGNDGYKHFDSYHKKDGNKYGYETHSEYGQENKGKVGNTGKSQKHNDGESKSFYTNINFLPNRNKGVIGPLFPLFSCTKLQLTLYLWIYY